MLLVSLALFACILAVPAIPSIIETIRPRDDGMLSIAEGYVRDARWFGQAFRRKVAPFIERSMAGPSVHAMLNLRTEEDVHWESDLRIPPNERLRGIGIGNRVIVGHDAGIRDAYALQTLDVEDGVVARTLTSDDTMSIGESVRILRWIDADGDIVIGARSDLGLSAAGGGRVTLGAGVHFERVWGSPVVSRTERRDAFALATDGALVDASTMHGDDPTIVAGPVRLAAGTRTRSHLKAHGRVSVEQGAVIAGNLIARGDVTLASDVVVLGHIFCEGSVRLGPRTRVGRAGTAKTVYATGAILVADDVEVYGWVVSEAGGRTV